MRRVQIIEHRDRWAQEVDEVGVSLVVGAAPYHVSILPLHVSSSDTVVGIVNMQVVSIETRGIPLKVKKLLT